MKIINKLDSLLNNKTVQLICEILSILLCITSIISTSFSALLSWELITDHYKFEPCEYMFWIVILCSCLVNILCVIYLATKSFKRLMHLLNKKGESENMNDTVNAVRSKSINILKNKFLRISTQALLIIACVYMIMFDFISFVFNVFFLGSIALLIFGILPIAITILNIYSVILVYWKVLHKFFKL